MTTRSMASPSSTMPMLFLLRLAASMAASLTRLARSAPLKPTVCRAMVSRSTELSSGLPLAWTCSMPVRPLMSGWSRTTRRSKRPGRSRAGSRMSGRLVAASTMTLVEVSNPSISTRIWFRVCSLSSCPPPNPAPRWRPTASISSTKTMQGAFRLAWSKRSLTLEAPTPTNISTNSLPLMEKKGTPASPAMARASSVLPVPGAPIRSTPRGMRAPRARNFSGCLRNSTISWSSCLASSTPATSVNVTVGLAPLASRARLRLKLKAWLLAPLAPRMMKMNRTTSIASGHDGQQEAPPVEAAGVADSHIDVDGGPVRCPGILQQLDEIAHVVAGDGCLVGLPAFLVDNQGPVIHYLDLRDSAGLNRGGDLGKAGRGFFPPTPGPEDDNQGHYAHEDEQVDDSQTSVLTHWFLFLQRPHYSTKRDAQPASR